MNRLTIVILICLVSACREKEILRYEDGTVHFEIEKKDGIRHGKFVEYYVGGVVRLEQSWVNGQLHGKSIGYSPDGQKIQETMYKMGKIHSRNIYFDSGNLQEKQVFDLKERLIDFEAYHNNGLRDTTKQMPIFFLDKDTLSQGDENKFYARLGNADSALYSDGKLYLSDGIDQNNKLVDTIAVIESNNNRFEYSFNESKTSGRHLIAGRLVFKVKRGGFVEHESFLVTYPYSIE
jgi:hypothetical protein